MVRMCFSGRGHGRDGAGRVAGVNPRQLDVLHDGRDKGVRAVGQGVGFGFNGVVQEAVDQNGPFRGQINGFGDVFLEHLLVVDDFHAAAAQHKGGPDHDRVTDARGDGAGFLEADGHARLGHGNAHFLHHLAEPVAVLGQVDGVGGGAEDFHARGGQFGGQVQRSLAAKLHHHALGFLFLVNGQDVFDGQRLEIEFVGGVVIGGDGFRVAVDHDGLVTGGAQGKRGVHAAIVELDPLADPVGAAAQDHDFLAVAGGDLVGAVVSRVIIGGVFDAADGQGVPGFQQAQALAALAQGRLGQAEEFGEVFVGEPVLLGLDEEGVWEGLAFEFEDLLLQFDQLFHLLDEPRFDVGFGVELLH